MAGVLDVEALAELLERLCSSPDARQRLHDALAQLQPDASADAWMDSKTAAAYLGLKPNALHKLTSGRAIPSEQHVPRGKHWFKRSDLDAWRRGAFVSIGACVGPAATSEPGEKRRPCTGCLEIGAAGFEPAASCSQSGLRLLPSAAESHGFAWFAGSSAFGLVAGGSF